MFKLWDKVKVKVSLWERWGTATHIFNFSITLDLMTTSRSGRFTLKEINVRYSLNRRLGGLQSRSGRFREQKNLCPLQGIETRSIGHQSPSLVTVPNELSGLSKYVRDTWHFKSKIMQQFCLLCQNNRTVFGVVASSAYAGITLLYHACILYNFLWRHESYVDDLGLKFVFVSRVVSDCMAVDLPFCSFSWQQPL